MTVKFILSYCVFFLVSLYSVNTMAQVPAQTIPEFNFFRLDKTSFTNKDLAKEKKLFFIFFDSDCEHCQRAVAQINQHYGEIKKTALYLITLDPQQKINLFMGKYGSQLKGGKNVTLLQDKQYQFITKFQPKRYPSMFLYSPEKKLLAYEDNEASVFRILNMVK